MARSQRESDGTRARIVSTCRYKRHLVLSRVARARATRLGVARIARRRVEPPTYEPSDATVPSACTPTYEPDDATVRPLSVHAPLALSIPPRASHRSTSRPRLSARDTLRVFAARRARAARRRARERDDPTRRPTSVRRDSHRRDQRDVRHLSLPGRAKLSAVDATARCGARRRRASPPPPTTPRT